MSSEWDEQNRQILYKAVGAELAVDSNGNIVVNGSLDLTNSAIAMLPDNLSVRGSLCLRGTALTTLPNNLSIGGDLDLTSTAITTLPDTLSISGGLNLYGAAITALPENFSVGGYLNLFGTAITVLPGHLSVGDTLDIRNTAIRTLPDSLSVGGNLLLAGTGVRTLPTNLFLRGRLDLAGAPFTRGRGGIFLGNTIQINEKRSYAAPIAAAYDPVACLKKLLDSFDEPNGFAEWVAEPFLAAQELQQAAPDWDQEEHDQWSRLFQAIGRWQEATQPGGDFPLGRDGSAYGFEIEARNQEELETRTPHTTSQPTAKGYLEQVKQYFCVNKEWFPEGYYWNMHLNLSLTTAERKNAARHLDILGRVAHLLIAPNNAFGRNIYNASTKTMVFIHHVTVAPRCKKRADDARMEMKAASIHADLDVEYLFVCLDVIKQLIQHPQYIQPVLNRLQAWYQRYGLPISFKMPRTVESERVQAALFDRNAASFRSKVKQARWNLLAVTV